jgi:hypothetical protein
MTTTTPAATASLRRWRAAGWRLGGKDMGLAYTARSGGSATHVTWTRPPARSRLTSPGSEAHESRPDAERDAEGTADIRHTSIEADTGGGIGRGIVAPTVAGADEARAAIR